MIEVRGDKAYVNGCELGLLLGLLRLRRDHAEDLSRQTTCELGLCGKEIESA
jgi:hypothetical protein